MNAQHLKYCKDAILSGWSFIPPYLLQCTQTGSVIQDSAGYTVHCGWWVGGQEYRGHICDEGALCLSAWLSFAPKQ